MGSGSPLLGSPSWFPFRIPIGFGVPTVGVSLFSSLLGSPHWGWGLHIRGSPFWFPFRIPIGVGVPIIGVPHFGSLLGSPIEVGVPIRVSHFGSLFGSPIGFGVPIIGVPIRIPFSDPHWGWGPHYWGFPSWFPFRIPHWGRGPHLASLLGSPFRVGVSTVGVPIRVPFWDPPALPCW